MNIGVLINTYNRTDDTKINLEIIRNVWNKSKFLRDIKIVHTFSGKKEWYNKKYLEDDLVVIKNSWHFQGASDLIDVGIKTFINKYKNIDYVIVLASDTWLIKPLYIERLLVEMKNKQLWLSTCAWGLPDQNNIIIVGAALDFFIIDLKWVKKYRMFPLNYGSFQKKYGALFAYQRMTHALPEKLFLARYAEAVSRAENTLGIATKTAIDKILMLKDREPVHSHVDNFGAPIRKMYYPKIGLLMHHEPTPKKEILKNEKISEGKYIKKLLLNKDLSYYNNGITKMKHDCN